LRDALERRPHHLQCERQSKGPSHGETHQKNCRDHRFHLATRPNSELLSDTKPRYSTDGQIRGKERANHQIGNGRVPIRAAVHKGWHFYLVGEVLLSLRKQELFVAVALCFACRRVIVF